MPDYKVYLILRAVNAWLILTVAEFDAWFEALNGHDQEAITAAVRVLTAAGPMLGRPLVDRIAGSRYHNMKELRPPGRTHIRILFIFDPRRAAVLLLGGDKQGHWERWYLRSIPEAERRYERYLLEIDQSDP